VASQAGEFLDHDAYSRARSSVELRARRLHPDDMRVLSKEVISRLAGRFAGAESPVATPVPAEIDALCTALISDDPDAASRCIVALRAADTPADTIRMGHIAGAARRLGEWWDEDRVHFSDVTIGAGRLYAIMRAMRPNYYPPSPSRKTPVLFASTPGEIHTLGITMAADLFRSRGWEIDLHTGLDHDGIVRVAVDGRYAIVAIGASSRQMLAPLTRLIASLHVSSPVSSILVSGPLAAVEPELKQLVDADCVAGDAPTALAEMDRMHAGIEARSSRG